MLVEIASLLFNTLNEDVNISIKEILAKTESVELSKCLMELAQAGEKKGNYEPRLADAIKILEQYKEQKRNKSIKSKSEREEDMLNAYKNRGKENLYSVGM